MVEKESFQETSIAGCYLFTSPIHQDSRGSFREWFKAEPFLDFGIEQGNVSISGLGVLRGMHFSVGDESQAKVVTCVAGEIQDVLVDVRPTSPTFKEIFTINLSPMVGCSLLVAPGVAHGFLSLIESSTVVYLTSRKYDPVWERSLNAEDAILEGVWRRRGFTRSQKDQQAPFFNDLSQD